MSRHLPRSILLLLALAALSLWGSGCIVAGNMGTLGAQAASNPVDSSTADVSIDRQAFVLGTAFDFRYVRVISSLEMVTHTPTIGLPPGQSVLPNDNKETYAERRIFRLDVPALTFWEFDRKTMGYPGVMEHRHSIDLWARTGAAQLDGDAGGFVGGALTYYQADAFALSVTVDRWFEPAEFRALDVFGRGRTFEDQTVGWVIGFEVTLAAGEHALDIANTILGIDKSFQSNRHRWANAR